MEACEELKDAKSYQHKTRHVWGGGFNAPFFLIKTVKCKAIKAMT
jgi:hypothetical protein